MTELERYVPPVGGGEIVTAGQQDADSWIRVVADVGRFADYICQTDFVPSALRGKPAAIAAAILAGREMGLAPMTALQHVQVIQGSPGLSAEMARARVLAAGHEFKIDESTNTRCVVRGRRRGEEDWTLVTWTLDDAKQAGLVKPNSNWTKYPRRMLQARASGELAHLKFPDCVLGLPFIEELTDEGAGEPAEVAAGNGSLQPAKRTAQRKTRTAAPARPAAAPAAAPAPEEPTGPPLPGEDGYDEQPGDRPVTDAQLTKLHTVFTVHGVEDRDERLDIASRIVRRQLTTSKELTVAEAGTLIDTLERIAGGPDDFSAFLAKLIEDTEPAEDEQS